MFLINSSKMKPLTVALGLTMANSVFSFNYNDFDINKKIQPLNRVTSDHFKEISSNSYIEFTQRILFRNYIEQWKINTLFTSNAYQIIEDENFKAIVNMGEIAVPFILEEINQKPSLLVWALNVIYDRKVTDRANVTIEEACKLWVKELSK